VSGTGSRRIEIPSFLADGYAHALIDNGIDHGTAYDGADGSSLSLRRWQVLDWKGERPYVYLSKFPALKSITYTVDKDTWGVLSGFEDEANTKIYYGICKIAKRQLICVDMDWNEDERQFITPIVDRIVRSFRSK
jgi:hypothetical protein